METRLRLWSGIVLATFVILHLINLSLGVFSVQAMEAMRRVLVIAWNSPLGMTILLGGGALHIALAFYWLYRRPHFGLPYYEWIRVILGFSIPVLAAAHFAGTRVTIQALGIDVSYPMALAAINGGGWDQILRQALLVLCTWGHMAIGLHLWLRLRPGYRRALVVFWPLAVLVPVAALMGYTRAMADVVARIAAEPEWFAQTMAARRAAPAESLQQLSAVQNQIFIGFAALLAAAFLARFIRRTYRNRKGTFTVTYPSGEMVTVPLGMSILDASRVGRIPHASVCGGRGRCSTCRVRVSDGLADLPPQELAESDVLVRIKAAADVRLACQALPRRNITVTPLLPPTAGVKDALRPGGVTGQEKRVAIVFIDIRGSTGLAERNLAYDVVFILNEFFAEMATALKDTNGHYAQFNGDGLMAIYGLDDDFETGCRQALHGAAEMFRRLDRLNLRFAGELSEPLRIGIGIHGGDAIVGTMGPPASPILSAIGDAVNIAARLEAETKVVGRPLIVSRVVADAAGMDLTGELLADADIDGREEPVMIVGIADPSAIVLAEPADA